MTAARVAEFAAFQEMVLVCNKQREHFGPLTHPDATAQGANPLCGDRLAVHLQFAQEHIQVARYQGEMSAVTIAAAEQLCAAIEGQGKAEALLLLQAFLAALQPSSATDLPAALSAFAVLKHYPNRLKTASLPAATLIAALLGEQSVVSTEG